MNDRNEVAHYQPQGGPVATRPDDLIAAVLAATKDPTVDHQKMDTLANLAIKLQTHQQQQEFNKDLIAAMAEMPVISKEGRIVIPGKDGRPDRVQGTFAKFEDINRVVRPILRRFNLDIRFLAGEKDGLPAVTPILMHRNGYVDTGEALKVPLDTSGSKNNTQGAGSSVTYGKRYAMCAALNIEIEGLDNDGMGNEIPVTRMTNERESLVASEAQAAFDAGEYAEWFPRQSPKDRSWLVTTGRHAGFGGQVALPAPSGAPAAQAAAPRSDKMTLDQQADAYIESVGKITTLEGLTEYQTDERRASWLAGLKSRRADLHERIVNANAARYAAISGGNA